MKRSYIKIAVILVALFVVKTEAQSVGFGCLGLSGFYGGYGVHTYEATGLNQSLNLVYTNLSSDPVEFKQGTGFRVGANILRADFDDVFLTAKGFFQFSKETKSADYISGTEPATLDFQLTTNHWGIGVDFGVPIFSFLDLKLVEGGVTFYSIELNEKTFQNDIEISEEKYNNDNMEVGYYVGTGFIINLIEDYISIEGTALYHFYEIESVKNSDGLTYPISSVKTPFIERGGVAAAVQLNIGFPL